MGLLEAIIVRQRLAALAIPPISPAQHIAASPSRARTDPPALPSTHLALAQMCGEGALQVILARNGRQQCHLLTRTWRWLAVAAYRQQRPEGMR